MGKSIEWAYINQITNFDIAKIEQVLGIKFPSDFKKFVITHNEGWPTPSEFLYTEKNGKRDVGAFGSLLDFKFDSKKYSTPLNIINSLKIDNRLPDKVVPFCSEGSGNHVCFDFRKNSDFPSIVYFVHDDSAEEPLYWVADTFTEFLDKLFDSEEEEEESSE